VLTYEQQCALQRVLGRDKQFRLSETIPGAIEITNVYRRPRELPRNAPDDTLPKLSEYQLDYIRDLLDCRELRCDQTTVTDCILGYELVIEIKALLLIPQN